MSIRNKLDEALRTDPADGGCDDTMSSMHVYVDLMLAGANAAEALPSVAAHLRECDPCHEDYEGLLLAA